jgi:hypothetical protein
MPAARMSWSRSRGSRRERRLSAKTCRRSLRSRVEPKRHSIRKSPSRRYRGDKAQHRMQQLRDTTGCPNLWGTLHKQKIEINNVSFFHHRNDEPFLMSKTNGIACIEVFDGDNRNTYCVKHVDRALNICELTECNVEVTNTVTYTGSLSIDFTPRTLFASTSAAFGMFCDPKMSPLPLGTTFEGRLAGVAPQVHGTLHTGTGRKSVMMRCADGAYFDQHGLFSVWNMVKDSCDKRCNILVLNYENTHISEWVHGRAKVHNMYPDISMFDDIKEETLVSETHYNIRRASTLYHDAAKGSKLEVNIYVLEVYTSMLPGIDALPANTNPGIWSRLKETCVKAVQTLSSELAQLHGVAASGGGMKAAIIAWSCIKELENTGKLNDLKGMSGCSGGAWGIMWYQKHGAIRDVDQFVASVRQRLDGTKSSCPISLKIQCLQCLNNQAQTNFMIKTLDWLTQTQFDWAEMVYSLLNLEDGDFEKLKKPYKICIPYGILPNASTCCKVVDAMQ